MRSHTYHLSQHEKKQVNAEIKRQLAEYDKAHAEELDNLVLYILHTEFGFGKKRLKKFYIHFMNGINSLIDRYDMDDEDAIWGCTHKLKEYGLTVEDLQNEQLVEKDKR